MNETIHKAIYIFYRLISDDNRDRWSLIAIRTISLDYRLLRTLYGNQQYSHTQLQNFSYITSDQFANSSLMRVGNEKLNEHSFY